MKRYILIESDTEYYSLVASEARRDKATGQFEIDIRPLTVSNEDASVLWRGPVRFGHSEI